MSSAAGSFYFQVPVRCVVGAAALIATATAGSLSAFAQQKQGAPPVVAAPVTQQEVSSVHTLVGTIVPLRTSVVGSAVDGRLIEFFVNEGDAVKAGQPLAQVLTGTIEIELARAKAEAELARHELAELENGTRPEEIQQFKARMESAQATAEYAAARHGRNQALFQRSQAITEDEMERSHSVMVEAQRAYADAQAAYALAVAGPRKERVEQARSQLLVKEEAVNFIADRLKKYTVRAPFDGYVISEGTEQGQWIKEAEPVAEIAELGQVEARFFLPEAYIARVRLGMKVAVRVDAYPGREFTGTVSRIVPQADLRSRTFPVKVLMENIVEADGPLLKGGMLARVDVAVGQSAQALIVPKDALVLGGQQPVVQVVDYAGGSKTGKVRGVPVKVGMSHGDWIQVDGSVKAGQHVVIRGNERLQPGQEVEVVQVAAAPGAGR